jgi:prolyl-tRNA synthetase
VKSIVVMRDPQGEEKGEPRMTMLLVRGDHMLNEVKTSKLEGLKPFRFATDAEIRRASGLPPDRWARWVMRACASSPTAPSPR